MPKGVTFCGKQKRACIKTQSVLPMFLFIKHVFHLSQIYVQYNKRASITIRKKQRLILTNLTNNR
jgi:hypothetical protein